MVEVGDNIPDVDLWVLGSAGPRRIPARELLGTGRVVLFGVPGAFTPGCSLIHLPGFLRSTRELADKGIDRIVCVAVNDAWVVDAWAKAHHVGDAIVMAADGNAEFTTAMGLGRDRSDIGLGARSERYAAVIEDGRFVRLDVEPRGGVDVTSCESVLTRL